VSYTVLAVKWRPKRFETLVGQADVVKALVNSLTAGRIHHAYLFSGTRGVGKTTVARILAKALNCESGVSAEPCGECAACVAIDEGRFVDLIEVDAASRTKVDDTRELLDNVQYMPTRGRFKVYLIDEVHMLSTHSFNALLKTLEEPPPHVKFLFATTDPQKLPVTVLSRCLQFNLKKLSASAIATQLAEIVASEGLEAEPAALQAIARSAAGSMRDGLSLLDQAIAFGGGRITAADVGQMLGSIDRHQVVQILEALIRADGEALLEAVDRLDEQGADFATVLDEIMSALQRVAVAQLVDARRVTDDGVDWASLAASMQAEDVQLYYQIALGGRRDISVCRDERMSFEMTLLRMLAFRPVVDARPASTESAHTAGGASDTAGRAPHAAGRAPQHTARGAPHTAGGRVPRMAERRERSAEPRPHAPAQSPQSTPVTGISDWQALVRRANLRGAVRNLAEHCVLSSVENGRVELVLDSDKANFNTDQLRQRLEQALAEHLQGSLTLKITIGRPPSATPAQLRRENEDQRMRDAREAIEQDPTIQAVQAAFDATVEPDSIQPARTDT
jgi:DNA polymerase-3 subunit gamma/tau